MRILENILFAVGMFLLIPPVPSMSGTKYGLFPLGALAVVLFSFSRFFAVRRGGESKLWAVVQVLLFLAFGIIMRDRAQMFS